MMSVMLLGAVALGFTACGGGDDEPLEPNNTAQNEQGSQVDENGPSGTDDAGEAVTPDIVVNVDADGNADGGHTFVKADDSHFYIDGLTYYIYNSQTQALGVSGFAPDAAPTDITIFSQVNYGGKEMKVESISMNAFRNKSELKTVTMGNSVTRIGRNAFENCTSLTSINLSSSLKELEREAFRGCSSLTSIVIPKNTINIGWQIFSGCSSLASIVVEEGNAKLDSRGGCNAIIYTSQNEIMHQLNHPLTLFFLYYLK